MIDILNSFGQGSVTTIRLSEKKNIIKSSIVTLLILMFNDADTHHVGNALEI